ncbi:MAG TPA: cation:proton antiporter [Thermomicrobiales bacterium]|nr:cation:proton antiporter [Thermomicrobiales bacterium]
MDRADHLLAALLPLAATEFDEHALVLALGAIGLVVVASGLVSGMVERLPISQVLIFVFLGVVVGPWGLGVFDLGIDSPAVQSLATVSLTLVLFTDAIKINLGQLRTNWILPALALGPGTLLTIAFVGGASWLLFDLTPPMALLVGTILASTDAVLLRDVTRDARIPLSVRHALSVEAGTNDLIVLPLTLFLALLASGVARSGADWARFAFSMLVLAPLVGIASAWVAIRAVDWLRRRRLIRRDYESIYSIGVAFLAFAAAQLLGGSGFVAAFAAGATIAALDIELCDCFLEYGETTAEIAMLLTFVVLGSALVAAAIGAFGLAAVGFALFCLLVARPVAFLASLWRAEASWGGRLLLAWFGPRGLNSILLLILAVSLGIPDAAGVFGIVATVVLASVVLHGTTATPLAAWYGRRAHALQLPEETLVDAGSLFHVDGAEPSVPRTTPAALWRKLDGGEPVTVVDVRRWQPFESSGRHIPGSIRIPIDEIPHRLGEIPRDRPAVLSCA